MRMMNDCPSDRISLLIRIHWCRHRHLLNDLTAMLPHGRKDVKFDQKSRLYELNELAEVYNCNNVLFFEARKGKDLYVHLAKVPNGPTVKFHLQNREFRPLLSLLPMPIHIDTPSKVHTIDELHFTGNCLKGSRPILSFDLAFDNEPYLRCIKELFLHVFESRKARASRSRSSTTSWDSASRMARSGCATMRSAKWSGRARTVTKTRRRAVPPKAEPCSR